MSHLHQVEFESPIGIIEIVGTDEAILSISFSEKSEINYPISPDSPQVITDCQQQLEEYFKGQRMKFTIPFLSTGTEFQRKVWTALIDVPYAETVSYGAIAKAVGSEKAVRAVGNANSKNKLSIIVPCHRIIGANGKLTGYAGTLPRKEWLLDHEKAYKENQSK
ncbi:MULTISPECIES: methylated-DNA--[protein]-cysteine S-methyltransferase [Planococcus]|uniref:Methylated-DNA--protein-cysteine methyltransferase n=1 Tax=Planococcus faecalis TaxID=1598147 RepID=A0ABN4XSU3_9BACL|nr:MULTISPECIES: methylated-DNA--[protein]-cysteine S-methyltransferase [Planococcus]AQU80770.1 cysteine methyltransferase [Planococcus faecalis]MDJ0331987.1 methylated-DNA--[protein]-cysteine S-methyltransferase [Planococcus sp. S3-L1]OHX55756.1 cysteine methyltransferase [Planococcus faecalis]